MKNEILLIGSGGHATSCIDVIQQNASFSIYGLIGRSEEIGNRIMGYRVIGTDDELKTLRLGINYALVCIGQIKSSENRKRIFKRLLELKFIIPNITSPYAYISSNATIGAGTIVMHGAVINAGVRIGDNCIINSQALIEHGAIVGDHSHVSTGAIVNGEVKINEGCFIGSGSRIKEGATIGKNCFVGMGSNVHLNLADNTLFKNG